MKSFSAIAVLCALMGHTGMLSSDPPKHLLFIWLAIPSKTKPWGFESREDFPLIVRQGNSGPKATTCSKFFPIDQAGQVGGMMQTGTERRLKTGGSNRVSRREKAASFRSPTRRHAIACAIKPRTALPASRTGDASQHAMKGVRRSSYRRALSPPS